MTFQIFTKKTTRFTLDDVQIFVVSFGFPSRMKFGHRLFHSVVPEWKDQYIDYKKLKGIIGETATDALSLAKAYDTVLRLTSVVVDENVHLLQLQSEQTFFDQLEEEVARAEAFYRQRLIEAVQNFYLLVQVRKKKNQFN
jgi:SPX domain protein involved in polyphosphate accumulation